MKEKKYIISLISSVIHSILLLLVLFVLGNKVVQDNSLIEDKSSFYNSVNSNFIVYGLNSSQQEEFRNMDNVDYVYSYYLYETNATISVNGFKTNIAIYCDSDLSNTPFSNDRLIESQDATNPIYIDYKFSKTYNLKLNDSINIKLGTSIIEAKVSGIYKTNYLNDAQVMIKYSDYKSSIDSMFDSFETNYSYIHTNDAESFDAYLKTNYVPKAFMQTREDFNSDIDYEIYLNSYLNKNYYNSANVNKIVVDDFNLEKSAIKTNLMISLIVIVVGILMCDLIVAIVYMRKLRIVSLATNDYKSYAKIHLISLVLSCVVGTTCIIFIPMTFSSSFVKISLASAVLKLIPIVIAFFISVIVGYGIKYYLTYKTLSSGKKQNLSRTQKN